MELAAIITMSILVATIIVHDMLEAKYTRLQKEYRNEILKSNEELFAGISEMTALFRKLKEAADVK